MPYQTLSDERLARLAAAGDDAALSALYARYEQVLHAYCRSITHHEEDAQDALQNTAVSAWRGLRRGLDDSHIRGWLFRIAHNESVSVLRRRRPAASLDEDALEARLASQPLDHQVLCRERLGELLSDVGALPEQQRSALVLRSVDGLSYDEISVALGVSSGAARQRVSAARRGLRHRADGRELSCAAVRETLRSGDHRTARSRAVQSHLRACGPCTDFAAVRRKRKRKTPHRGFAFGVPALLAALRTGAPGLGGSASPVSETAAGGAWAGAATAGALGVKAIGAVVLAVGVGVGAGGVALEQTTATAAPSGVPAAAAPSREAGLTGGGGGVARAGGAAGPTVLGAGGPALRTVTGATRGRLTVGRLVAAGRTTATLMPVLGGGTPTAAGVVAALAPACPACGTEAVVTVAPTTETAAIALASSPSPVIEPAALPVSAAATTDEAAPVGALALTDAAPAPVFEAPSEPVVTATRPPHHRRRPSRKTSPGTRRGHGDGGTPTRDPATAPPDGAGSGASATGGSAAGAGASASGTGAASGSSGAAGGAGTASGTGAASGSSSGGASSGGAGTVSGTGAASGSSGGGASSGAAGGPGTAGGAAGSTPASGGGASEDQPAAGRAASAGDTTAGTSADGSAAPAPGASAA